MSFWVLCAHRQNNQSCVMGCTGCLHPALSTLSKMTATSEETKQTASICWFTLKMQPPPELEQVKVNRQNPSRSATWYQEAKFLGHGLLPLMHISRKLKQKHGEVKPCTLI